MTLTTPDGAWSVQQISIDGYPTLMVQKHAGGRAYLPHGYGSGYYATPEQVAAVIGADAFATLRPA